MIDDILLIRLSDVLPAAEQLVSASIATVRSCRWRLGEASPTRAAWSAMRPDYGQAKQKSGKSGIPVVRLHGPPMLLHHQLVGDGIDRPFRCRGDAALAESQRTATPTGLPEDKRTRPPDMGHESINGPVDDGGEERRETFQESHGRPHLARPRWLTRPSTSPKSSDNHAQPNQIGQASQDQKDKPWPEPVNVARARWCERDLNPPIDEHDGEGDQAKDVLLPAHRHTPVSGLTTTLCGPARQTLPIVAEPQFPRSLVPGMNAAARR